MTKSLQSVREKAKKSEIDSKRNKFGHVARSHERFTNVPFILLGLTTLASSHSSMAFPAILPEAYAKQLRMWSNILENGCTAPKLPY